MSKVTSKLQVTIPKVIADRYGIAPGHEIDFVPAGDTIRVIPVTGVVAPNTTRRLELFDQATRRQADRERASGTHGSATGRPDDRGWTRDELYARAGAD